MSQKVPVEMANMPVITVGTAPFTLKTYTEIAGGQ